jgi:predicted alpha/beta-fold hydrolase
LSLIYYEEIYMASIKKLNFKPFWGLSSKHLQILLSSYSWTGKAPPSKQCLVDIGNGDQLSCEVSTPLNWDEKTTIALVHGLSGSHESNYMIRMARKLYHKGYKVVRINLRGCGSGVGLSKLPSGAGNSRDLLKVLHSVKEENPNTHILLIGFSLGGNTTLKLAGELGEEAKKLVKKFIAVCPPLDLEETARLIQQPKHFFYHYYYISRLRKQAKAWIKTAIRTIHDYDEAISAPLWGFKDAHDYYSKCSSIRFLDKIRCETHIVLAEDDPFISPDILKKCDLPDCIHVWLTPHGGHLGFLGRPRWQWMDDLLLQWVKDDV